MEGANAGSTRGQVLRFGALGGANTALTTAAFYLLAWVLPAEVAFTIVYAAGIVFVALTTPRYVFRATSSWRAWSRPTEPRARFPARWPSSSAFPL